MSRLNAFTNRWRHLPPASPILLLGALTRFWRLDYHSVWFDEAVSLRWAASDISYIWQVTFKLVQEKHPPAYFITLHLWRDLAGWFGLMNSDAFLRASGSILGVLTVWGVLKLGTWLGGQATGRVAGLLVALSPLLTWYSQELRMFQPATTGIVWFAVALAVAWDEPRRRRRFLWWLLAVLTMTYALYAYLFSAFMLPAAGFTLLALAVRDRRWPRFAEGAATLGVIGLLFAPLARNAWNVNAAESTPGVPFANFLPNLVHLLQIHTIWRVAWPEAWQIAALALFALLILLGLLLPRRGAEGDNRPLRLWLWLWLGVPLLIANLLLARSSSIFSEDRYLLFLAPFILTAVAAGAVGLTRYLRPAGWTAAAAALLVLAAALPPLWTPARARENWRAAADYIVNYQAQSPNLPGAVVAHVDYTHLPLEWYIRKTLSFDELPVFFPFGGTLTPADIDTQIAPPLNGLVDFGADTLWLTQSHLDGVDDQRLVEQWLTQHFPLITEQYPAGLKLSGYMLQSQFAELPTLSPAAVYPDAELQPGLRLAACEITTPVVAAQDDAMHPPSGWVHVRLWWVATAPLMTDYVATAQVIGPEGVWGDRLHRPTEALRVHPTSTWPLDVWMRDELDINLNPVTPPGDYPVIIGVADATGASVGGTVNCGQVTVQ